MGSGNFIDKGTSTFNGAVVVANTTGTGSAWACVSMSGGVVELTTAVVIMQACNDHVSRDFDA